MLNQPQDFELRLVDGVFAVYSSGTLCKFAEPASTPKRAKLYTVTQGSSLIYVGIATRRMSTRLTYGFTATGKSGYHGYKWKTLSGSLWLSVWTAPAKDDLKEELLEMETIEAEVAFLCRQRAGQWPAFQQEIHFSPSLQQHRDDAERVYTHATRGQPG